MDLKISVEFFSSKGVVVIIDGIKGNLCWIFKHLYNIN